MKISQFNIKILQDELKALQTASEAVDKAADAWLEQQKQREKGWGIDQEWISVLRYRLEKTLINYRHQLAAVYDYMGDRGLVDFVPERDIEDEEVHA